jgi:metal-responsive CopG/Arc/MetJ family transcriptional regulator
MSMANNTQITIRISAKLLRKLDDLRRSESDVPTRAEMMRRLIGKTNPKASSKTVLMVPSNMAIHPGSEE